MSDSDYKKGSWSENEDALLIKAVEYARKPIYEYVKDEIKEKITESRSIDWIKVAEEFSGKRKPNQCRQRWINYLSPSIRSGDWTAEEDKSLIDLFKTYGSRWSKIAKQPCLRGRSVFAIRTRFRSLLAQQKHVDLVDDFDVEDGSASSPIDQLQANVIENDIDDEIEVKQTISSRKRSIESTESICSEPRPPKMQAYSSQPFGCNTLTPIQRFYPGIAQDPRMIAPSNSVGKLFPMLNPMYNLPPLQGYFTTDTWKSLLDRFCLREIIVGEMMRDNRGQKYKNLNKEELNDLLDATEGLLLLNPSSTIAQRQFTEQDLDEKIHFLKEFNTEMENMI